MSSSESSSESSSSGGLQGLLDSAVNAPANLTDAPGLEKDLLQNYIQGGHVSSTDLVGARMNKSTGRVFSPAGADITDVYAKYMDWQQTQRVNRSVRDEFLRQVNETPGRKQTILVEPTAKDAVLGVPMSPSKPVLG